MADLRPVRKLLIANRGEIACRIARTARRLGIGVVAVHSDADANARHVALADEAYRLGPAPATESYLRIDRVLEAAKATGADAIHPGYGFLAESAAFARACANAGLIYVGPPAEVIERLGAKDAAKEVAIAAGVPVLPGYQGTAQDDATLVREAKTLGYPLAVKAVAGGGGRGLRVVRESGGLSEALASARREANGAFGDDRLILERWLDRPRHVEVQILGDAHGNVVHLHERDCSLQRRHQKIVEEAPAPGLSDSMRGGLGAAAVALAKAVGYVNAGTVEFLVDANWFFFLEVNTRLQVEHPVTEFITGLDLVELQLRVASGAPSGLDQSAIPRRSHAIEVRLCAEDPARGFLPQTGRVARLWLPEATGGVRIDTGLDEGDTVGLDYDSLIAKIIVGGATREEARERMLGALRRTGLVGLSTNVEFLAALVAHPTFAAGAPDTGFLDRSLPELLVEAPPPPDQAIVAAAIAHVRSRASGGGSPWAVGRPWRLSAAAVETLRMIVAGEELAVRVTHLDAGYDVAIDGRTHHVRSFAEMRGSGPLDLAIDGARRDYHVHIEGQTIHILWSGTVHRLALIDPLAVAAGASEADGHLRAPMPGRVVKVMAEVGASVERGAPLLVLEAMKMEHTITAPVAGRVARMPFGPGDLVEEGTELVVFEDEA
ncbi:MAG: biotin carboxylase N-terminal domain-containing protein [Alphaproteobacteria bacterium]